MSETAISPIPKEWEDAANELQRANASVLEPWEQEFCERMALREKPLSATKQAKAASGLAGREVTVAEIKRLRDRRAYRTLKYAIRAHRQEVLDEARGIMLETLPDAARLQARAIRQLNDAKPGELDVRAVPPITQPYLDRTWPKKTESEHRELVVTVNLTSSQQANLDIPAIEVEAEEVEAEFIP